MKMIVKCVASKNRFFYLSKCWSQDFKEHNNWKDRGWYWFGPIREVVTDRIDHLVCQIETRDVVGNVIGYWAFGFDDPDYPPKVYYSKCWGFAT